MITLQNSFYFDTKQSFIQWRLNEALFRLIKKINKNYDSIAVICIGSDRLIGDCYGPLTGHMLSNCELPGLHIYGTLQNPVHALSITDTISKIDTENTLCIAVDCSVGETNHVGFVGVSYEPVKPGSGVGKNLPEVGDISITGIVASSGVSSFINLQNAPLGLIYGIAEKTCKAIEYSYKMMQYLMPVKLISNS
jgi:putative sporulation protein YyaC